MATSSSNSQAGIEPQSSRSKSSWLLPLALLAVYLMQCLWFISTQSLTYDEPVHIAEGLDAWRNGRFEQFNDHPPLARLLCTIPLIAGAWDVQVRQFPNYFQASNIAPDPVVLAWRARGMNVVLGLVLGWLVWWVARQMISESGANFALAFYAFCPALIAHFSLATTDGVATLTIFLAAWLTVRWRQNLSLGRVLLLGGGFGLLLLAKFSTIVMFFLGLGWILVSGSGRVSINPRTWRWGRTVGIVSVALFVVWAGYLFHVSRLSIHNGTLTATFPNWRENIVKPVRSNMNFDIRVPAGEYIEGFRTLVRHNRAGQAAFFLGRVSRTGGWKLYYPVVILLKWPLVLLLLILCGIVFVARGRLRPSADAWILASFPLLYLALAIFARFNIGERHVLPLYPFALLLIAQLWQQSAGKHRVRILLVILAALNAVDAMRVAPGYLSYFNPAASRQQSFRLLTDSNLDWGQGLLALRRYEEQHPSEAISLAYFGSVQPSAYGIRAQLLEENQRVAGTVVVSATNLSGQFLEDPLGYRWLLDYGPPEILDGSLHIFHVNQHAPTPQLRVCAQSAPDTAPCL